MSILEVRRSLEKALSEITPAIETTWENDQFKPTAGIPYQQVNLIPTEPDNPTIGGNFYRENGYLQVTLCWPLKTGARDATVRAELLRSVFRRGQTFTSPGGVKTMVHHTPEIGGAMIDGDRYRLPVKIRFFANIN